MSDLAPLVVAAAGSIRDKVVVDLKEENDKLRNQIDDVENGVRITGANGVPLYAYAHIKDKDITMDEYEEEGVLTRTLILKSHDEQQQRSTPNELQNVQVFVGRRQENCPLDEFDMSRATLHRQDEQGRSYARVHLRNCCHQFNFVELSMEIGPYEGEEQLALAKGANTIEELFERRLRLFPGSPTVTANVKARFLKVYLNEELH